MRALRDRPRRRSAQLAAVGLTATVLVGFVTASGAMAAPGDTSVNQFAVTHPIAGYAFSQPTAMAASGGNLFVANRRGNSVTELNAATGVWVRTITGFSAPTAVVGYGVDLFVANASGSVSEIDARTGRLVHVLAGATYGFSSPTSLAVYGTNLLVLNAGGSVTQVDAATGAVVRKIAGATYGFNHPSQIVVAGSQAWVTNSVGNSVTEFDATSGAWIRTLTSSSYQFQGPSGIAFDGSKLWVADTTDSQITVIVAATGALSRVFSAAAPGPAPVASGDLRVYVASPPGSSPMVTAYTAVDTSYQWMMCNSNGPYNFNNPQSLLVVGDVLWVANASSNSLTQLSATTGAYMQRIA